jgi:VanZ family protein
VWAAAIFYLSSQPDLGRVGRLPDWLTHGLAYCLLALLLARAVAAGTVRALRREEALGIVLATTLYGVSDEWHQSFTPGRQPSPADVGKDLGGAVLAVGAYHLAGRRALLAEREGAS